LLQFTAAHSNGRCDNSEQFHFHVNDGLHLLGHFSCILLCVSTWLTNKFHGI